MSSVEFSSMSLRETSEHTMNRYGYSSGGSAWDLGPPSSLYGSRYRYESIYRPRFTDNFFRPSVDDIYFRYRHYAPDDKPSDDGRISVKLDVLQRQNQHDHHTEKYLPDVKNLVLRRGQAFVFDISISSATFNQETDHIKVLFAAGKKPQESLGTLANVHVCNDKKDCSKDAARWKGYIASQSDDKIQVRITAPCDAIVSTYQVTVKVHLKDEDGKDKRVEAKLEDDMYLLFNPWMQGDQTFLEGADERNEYVLNDTGRVYQGSQKGIHGKPWVFGQFEKCCLEASVYLLDKSYLTKRSHGNVTHVTRALSAMANSCDYDNGVLTGNWSGNYAGGTAPTAWNGSVAILEEYMETNRPVKFGQCWVFSGLLTTLCRTLGIPTRSVTNFSSAHDTDCSMTIDMHYATTLVPLEHLNHDSVWNFHVWNESWFRRPDLPSGCDGWQAFDATPQEESESMMRCGPAPLTAIKEGNVYLGYDTKFIFAEVNGDRIVWLVDTQGDMKPLKQFCDQHSVGKDISTKDVGSGERMDITNLYKYPEGSKEERDAIERAMHFSARNKDLSSLYDDEDQPDDVNIKCDGECKPNGDIELKFGVRNTCTDAKRTVILNIRSTAVYYTGVVGEQLSNKQETLELDPEEGTELGWQLPAAAYLNMINEDAKLKVYVTAKVTENGQFFCKSEIFELDKPDIEIEASNFDPKVGEDVKVTLKFKNPVDVALTEGVFRLEGPGIQRHLKIPLHRKVDPGQVVEESVTVTPKYDGEHELIACFNSRQVTNITGVVPLRITK